MDGSDKINLTVMTTKQLYITINEKIFKMLISKMLNVMLYVSQITKVFQLLHRIINICKFKFLSFSY